MFLLMTDMFNGELYILDVDPAPEPTGQPTIYISDEDFEAWLYGDQPLLVERIEEYPWNDETP